MKMLLIHIEKNTQTKCSWATLLIWAEVPIKKKLDLTKEIYEKDELASPVYREIIFVPFVPIISRKF